MATNHTTKLRRIEQVLWSELDHWLTPFLKDGVVLAISGGPDSRALLESVATWRKRLGEHIVIATVNHHARIEAQKETQFLVQRAIRLGFEAVHESILNITGNSSENELRAARYAALTRVATEKNCKTICTAHHSEDDEEGYIMALMGVGGGELGASMKPVDRIRDLRLVRPFLRLNKKDLLLSLSAKNICDHVTDRLDQARVGQRAFVRHEVLPALYQKAPAIRGRLKLFALRQQQQQQVIEECSQKLINWGSNNSATISIDPRLNRAVLTFAIWKVLKSLNSKQDLRSCQPTVDRLVTEALDTKISGEVSAPGLDPRLNEFSLAHSKIKTYQFPGVIALKSRRDIILKRVIDMSH